MKGLLGLAMLLSVSFRAPGQQAGQGRQTSGVPGVPGVPGADSADGHRAPDRHLSSRSGRPPTASNHGHAAMFTSACSAMASRSSTPQSSAEAGRLLLRAPVRTHHLQVADDVLLLANRANIGAQSSTTCAGGSEQPCRQHHETNGSDRAEHSHLARRSRDRVPGNAGWHQPPVVAGRSLCIRVRPFRRFHRSHPALSI